MALPYITGRQGQVLSTEVVEKMATDGKIGGSGAGFTPVATKEDITKACTLENLGKIYQYQGKEYEINIQNIPENLEISLDEDIFYNKVKKQNDIYNFVYKNDEWQIAKDLSFEMFETSDSVLFYNATHTLGLIEDSTINYEFTYDDPRCKNFRFKANLTRQDSDYNLIAITGSGADFETKFEQPSPLTLIAYDGMHVVVKDDINYTTAQGGCTIVIQLTGSETPSIEKLEIYANGEPLIHKKKSCDLTEYGITVKGTPVEEDSFHIVLKDVDYTKYKLYQVEADSVNLPGDQIEVGDEIQEVYFNLDKQIDFKEECEAHGCIKYDGQIISAGFPIVITTEDTKPKNVEVEVNADNWYNFFREQFNIENIPETFNMFVCTDGSPNYTLEHDFLSPLLAASLFDLTDLTNVLTIKVDGQATTNVSDIPAGTWISVKVDAANKATAQVNNFVKERLMYSFGSSDGLNFEGIFKVSGKHTTLGTLEDDAVASTVLSSNDTTTMISNLTGTPLTIIQNNWCKESIQLSGKVAYVDERLGTNTVISKKPFNKDYINFHLAKMYDKLPEGIEEGKFLGCDANGNPEWQSINLDRYIYVKNLDQITDDQWNVLVNNPDMKIVIPHTWDVSSPSSETNEYYGIYEMELYLNDVYSANIWYVCNRNYPWENNPPRNSEIYTFNVGCDWDRTVEVPKRIYKTHGMITKQNLIYNKKHTIASEQMSFSNNSSTRALWDLEHSENKEVHNKYVNSIKVKASVSGPATITLDFTTNNYYSSYDMMYQYKNNQIKFETIDLNTKNKYYIYILLVKGGLGYSLSDSSTVQRVSPDGSSETFYIGEANITYEYLEI